MLSEVRIELVEVQQLINSDRFYLFYFHRPMPDHSGDDVIQDFTFHAVPVVAVAVFIEIVLQIGHMAVSGI